MPNWCAGTLKVRGEKENIKRFLIEGLSPINSTGKIAVLMGKEVPEVSIEITEDKYEMTLKTKEGFHINDTRRSFIVSKEITWYHDGDGILLLSDFQSAWGLDTGALTAISKKYELDFRIYAFERGMEFNQDFEVHKGEVIRYKEIKFDDYKWECVMPETGG